jgi:hydrogenase maturation protease
MTGVVNVTHSVSARPTVFVCGQPLRGDDAVGFEVVAALPGGAREAATIVDAGALDVTALASLPDDAHCIIVDAVAGVVPGELVELRLDSLADAAHASGLATPLGRSTHALAIPDTLALARLLRGKPLDGVFLGIGIAQCVPGAPLSPRVAAAVPAGADCLASLIARYANTSSPC